ncbi:MAG: ABC transporter permease [Spirochaetales bacterium]|nr:ABC transporter permease [Spirochaetales bacterium]
MKKMIPPMAVLTLIWWILSFTLNKPFLPGPLEVFVVMVTRFREGVLPPHLGISLVRVLAALVFSFIPALILGILAGRNPLTDRLMSPAVYLLFPIPKVALLPIILLFMGLGDGSKIFFVALIVFFQFYLNIRDEAAGISRQYFDSLTTLGGGKLDELRHIVLPALMPRIFSSLRMTLGTAIAVLFLAETFATRTGIGWFIMDAWSRIAYADMYAGILSLSLAGLVLFLILDLFEGRVCRWK